MITGVIGVIRWHDYVAAAIHGYTVQPLDRQGRAWSLRATVVVSNPFNLTQRPLTFVAKHKGGEWRWPIEQHEMQTQHGTPVLTARLGPEETGRNVTIRTP